MEQRIITAKWVDPQRNRFTLVEGIVVTLVLILFVIAVSYLYRQREINRYKDRAARNCPGNLKQIGLGLLMYSGDYGGYFPVLGAPGSRNFEPLNSLDTLADGRVYSCPAVEYGRSRPASNADFIYVGSGLKDDNDYAPQIRLAFDASGNHPDNAWISVLFIDGHAESGPPDGSKGWNTYASPTSPDPAGVVPPTANATTTSPTP